MEIEMLQSVRFIVGTDGKPTDVILSFKMWEKIIEWLEDLEDAKIIREATARLKLANGNPKVAGLISWTQAQKQLDLLEVAA